MVDCEEASASSIFAVAAMVWLWAGVVGAACGQDMMYRV